MGLPLYMDQMTESGRQLSYAKICVEVDSSSTLPNSFNLKYSNGDMVEIRIQYPWKPLVCSDCLVFGHGISSCPQKAVHKEKGATKTTGALGKAGVCNNDG